MHKSRVWAPCWEYFKPVYDSKDIHKPEAERRILKDKCTLCIFPIVTEFSHHGSTKHMNDHLYGEEGHNLPRPDEEEEEEVDEEDEQKTLKEKPGKKNKQAR